MGLPLGTHLAQQDSLAIPRDLPPLVLLEEAAYTSRPDLGDLGAQRAGAKANTSLLKEYWLPDFTLGASRDSLVTSRVITIICQELNEDLHYEQCSRYRRRRIHR